MVVVSRLRIIKRNSTSHCYNRFIQLLTIIESLFKFSRHQRAQEPTSRTVTRRLWAAAAAAVLNGA